MHCYLTALRCHRLLFVNTTDGWSLEQKENGETKTYCLNKEKMEKKNTSFFYLIRERTENKENIIILNNFFTHYLI